VTWYNVGWRAGHGGPDHLHAPRSAHQPGGCRVQAALEPHHGPGEPHALPPCRHYPGAAGSPLGRSRMRLGWPSVLSSGLVWLNSVCWHHCSRRVTLAAVCACRSACSASLASPPSRWTASPTTTTSISPATDGSGETQAEVHAPCRRCVRHRASWIGKLGVFVHPLSRSQLPPDSHQRRVVLHCLLVITACYRKDYLEEGQPSNLTRSCSN
jgi:hypothetical protein